MVPPLFRKILYETLTSKITLELQLIGATDQTNFVIKVTSMGVALLLLLHDASMLQSCTNSFVNGKMYQGV